MTPISTTQQQHIPGSAWSKNGNVLAKHEQSEKVSSEESQQISKRPWTKTGTPSSRASTPPTATQPPSKSSNILTHNGVCSTFMPRKIYDWRTTPSGTTRFISQPSENASMTIKSASNALESPSPTKTSSNFTSSKCTDKKEMTEWENKAILIKDDFVEAKL